VSTTTSRQHLLARRIARAALMAILAFTASSLFLFAFVVALFGLHETFAPVIAGLFGPPLIDVLLRPIVVIAAVVGGAVGVVSFLEAGRGGSSVNRSFIGAPLTGGPR